MVIIANWIKIMLRLGNYLLIVALFAVYTMCVFSPCANDWTILWTLIPTASRTTSSSSRSRSSLVASHSLTNSVCAPQTALIQCKMLTRSTTAPEATQVGEHTVTQKHLYAGLFVIGIPMFLWAGPFGTFFGIFFGSTLLILVHASLLEPGVESDYASIQDTV